MKESGAVKTISKTPGRCSEKIECRTTDPLQKRLYHQSDEIEVDDSEEQKESSCQSNEIKTEDRELPYRSKLPVQGAGIVTDGGGTKDEEPHSPPVYYYKGGELFAEDVEQHLAVPPEVAKSSTEITIDDVQV